MTRLERAAAAACLIAAACAVDPTTAPEDESAAVQSVASIASGQSAGIAAPGEIDPTRITRSGFAGAAVYPVFNASPFAPDFIVTGSETPPGPVAEHFIPSNGDGTFGTRSDIAGLGVVDGMDVADLDLDGDNDFLVCDGSTGEVILYRGDGAGTFTPSTVASGITAFFCTNLRIADFNHDALPDFVVGDNRVVNGMHLYLQTIAGTFTRIAPGLDIDTWSTVNGNSIFGVAAGDVDGDGHADVVVLGYGGIGAGQVRFYKGDGGGRMAPSVQLFNVATDFGVFGTVGLSLFDLENDGDLDIIVGGGSDGSHFVYLNSGTGTFTRPAGPAFDVNSQTGIDAFDLDHDGDQDLVVAVWNALELVWMRNDNGTLAGPSFISNLAGFSLGVGAPELVVSPEGLIQSMLARIASLLTDGELNRGQANALSVKLQHALDRLASSPGVAINLLNAFRNQVQDLVADGVLDPAEGAVLIRLVDTAIATISS